MSELKEKLRQTEEETDMVIRELLLNLEIVPISEYGSFIRQAIEVSPDEYDAPYFALALRLKVPLWSNEKRLKKQNVVKVFNTQEIMGFMID